MTEFYKEKGMFRQTIILSPEGKQKLEALAKEQHVPQGTVVEVLLDFLTSIDGSMVNDAFEFRRNARVDRRRVRDNADKLLLEKVKQLSPEKLLALLGQAQ